MDPKLPVTPITVPLSLLILSSLGRCNQQILQEAITPQHLTISPLLLQSHTSKPALPLPPHTLALVITTSPLHIPLFPPPQPTTLDLNSRQALPWTLSPWTRSLWVRPSGIGPQSLFLKGQETLGIL